MAEQQAAELQAAEPPARMPANPLTRYMGWRTRPTLPAVDLAREHDSVLADFLEQAAAADGAAVRAQLEWEQHQPGGGGFNAVVTADATWAQPFIERNEEPPVAGPLWDWLTRGAHELLIEAVHRRQQSDHADRVVRKYAANPKLVERLDEAADTIQEQIRLLFIETRVEKSRRAYERAQDLCPSWNRAASLSRVDVEPHRRLPVPQLRIVPRSALRRRAPRRRRRTRRNPVRSPRPAHWLAVGHRHPRQQPPQSGKQSPHERRRPGSDVMGEHYVVLPAELHPRGQLMVWGPDEYNGAASGFATATPGPDGLVVSVDDATFNERCRGGSQRDPYLKDHSHRLDISQGGTPYAKPILVETPTGFDLVGLELAGMDLEDGNYVEFHPGAKPLVTFPPKPEVNLEPLPSLW